MNRAIPCVLMRAGTSRGPFFLREWLPADERERDEALIGAIGASDLLQVDGVGGGSTLTSKVAIVSKSSQPGCDVDYLFAQVGVGQKSVDMRPNCGNMLSGVGPFAIEQGLVPARDRETTVRVFNVNTRTRIDVKVLTPDRRVTYEGETGIDGVAGTAAPIRLDFLDAWGAVTGSLFPTGRRIDTIEGVKVTCIDAAMPLVIVQARALGLSGRETPAELDADRPLLERIEALRRASHQDTGENALVFPVIVDILELVIRNVTADLLCPPVFHHPRAFPIQIVNLRGCEEFKALEHPSGGRDIFYNNDLPLAVPVRIIRHDPQVDVLDHIGIFGFFTHAAATHRFDIGIAPAVLLVAFPEEFTAAAENGDSGKGFVRLLKDAEIIVTVEGNDLFGAA